MLDAEALTFAVARLDLMPGDVLVIRLQRRISAEAAARLSEDVRRVVGDRRILILDEGVDLAVLTRREIEVLDGG